DKPLCIKHRRKPLDLRDGAILSGGVQRRRLDKVGEGEKVAIRSRRAGDDPDGAEIGGGNLLERPDTALVAIAAPRAAYVVETVGHEVVTVRGSVVDGLAWPRLHHQLEIALA